VSYAKAADLLRVAEMAMSRFDGIALQDVAEEFDCDHRTAQRMMRSFETVFPRVDIHEGEDRRRRWHLPRHDPRWLQAQGIRDGELAAMELAAKRAERDGAPDEAQRLTDTAITQIAAQARALTGWLADQGYTTLHFELPFQETAADGSEINAIVDCLAEGPHGLLIIDHKSGPCPDPAARFATYQPQLAGYAAIVHRHWPDKPLQGVAIHWMSEGRLSHARLPAEADA